MPGTMLPLTIFEPRYRAMVSDALAGDRTIGMAMLYPGWETAGDDDPRIYSVGGAGEMIARGYGNPADLEHLESRGVLPGADPGEVSARARQRGADQLGTMGAGNHFVEVQAVADVFDEKAATALGLERGRVTVMIHTGSRGLGHQVATDFIRTMFRAMPQASLCVVPNAGHGPIFAAAERDAFVRTSLAFLGAGG